MNEVDNLLELDFFSLNYENQLKIKQMGPHQPKNFEHQQMDKAQTRSFSSMWFDKVEWLTVSISKKMFYCFYCVIFDGSDNPWCKDGYRDLKHLSERIKKHQYSAMHITSAIKFKTLGMDINNFEIGGESGDHALSYNEAVNKNRNVLNTLINCIKFCGAHNLPLKGYNEKVLNSQDSILPHLVTYIATLDNTLLDNRTNLNILKHTDNKILTELLDCIYEIYQDEVKKEIQNTNFVALEVEQITDISNNYQFMATLRFLKNEKVVERFLELIEVDEMNASTLADTLQRILKTYGVQSHQLISQSYDTNIIIDKPAGVQHLLKRNYQFAKFIHSSSHQFEAVIKNMCSKFPPINDFFINLSGFKRFFSPGSKQSELIQTEISQNNSTDDIGWKSQDLTSVYENQVEISTCLDRITTEGNWPANIVDEAHRLSGFLNDEEFFSYLDFFHNIVQEITFLYKSCTTPGNRVSLKNFRAKIVELTNNFGAAEDLTGEPPNKRSKTDATGNDPLAMISHIGIAVMDYAKELHDSAKYIHALSLVDPNAFPEYRIEIPEDHIRILESSNGAIFNRHRLSNELDILYENEIFSNATDVEELYKILDRNDLLGTLKEVSKLAEIALITPIKIKPTGTCSNITEKIKTCLQTSFSTNTNPLEVLYVHQNLLKDISGFNNTVIERFATINNRKEYLYKQ